MASGVKRARPKDSADAVNSFGVNGIRKKANHVLRLARNRYPSFRWGLDVCTNTRRLSIFVDMPTRCRVVGNDSSSHLNMDEIDFLTKSIRGLVLAQREARETDDRKMFSSDD